MSTLSQYTRIGGINNSFVISVLNYKGGCGKTTITTNIASLLADRHKVFIMDYDPQQSTLKWLKVRYNSSDSIQGINISNFVDLKSWWKGVVPLDTDIVLIDSPAGVQSTMLDDIITKTNIIIVPILPSAHDMRSTAEFIETLLLNKSYRMFKPKISVIANKVRENFASFLTLQKFLYKLNIPVIATLSDDEIYIKSAEIGKGFREIATPTHKDYGQWQTILEWIEFNKNNHQA